MRSSTTSSRVFAVALLGLAAMLPGLAETQSDLWSSIRDVATQVPDQSINYTSSDSSVLPNRLTAIFFIDEWGYDAFPAGGFDLQNGVVTSGFFNDTANDITWYGLAEGDSANGNGVPCYSIEYEADLFWRVFYDADGDGNYGYRAGQDILETSEELPPTSFLISNFTPYGSTTPGTFTFTYTPFGFTGMAVAPVAGAERAGGLDVSIRLDQVGKAARLLHKNALSAATWVTNRTLSLSSTAIHLADTNSAPSRFYRIEVEE